MSSIHSQSQAQQEEEHEQFTFAMNLANATVLPMALRTVLELDLIEIISNAGPGAHLSPLEIASHLSTQNPDAPNMIDRLLGLLSCYSILHCSVGITKDGRVERLYGLSPFSKFVTRNHQDGVSVASLILLHQDKVFMENWFELKNVVLEGGYAFNKAQGMGAFEYTGIDPRFNKVFNKAMWDHTSLTMKKVLEMYNGFADLKELVDVAGGVGGAISMITSKYPHIKGINFDLPHVIANASSYPGVEHVHGDMFVGVPKGEAIFMKWILHDWTDELCVKLLKHCWDALPISGKVIIVEQLLPVSPDSSPDSKVAFQYDVLMLTQTPGGKERTLDEFEQLATRSGFTSCKAVCRAYNSWILEFYKGTSSHC